MEKFKTEFELSVVSGSGNGKDGRIRIITEYGTSNVSIKTEQLGNGGFSGYLEGKELEQFAINILRSMKSKKLSHEINISKT